MEIMDIVLVYYDDVDIVLITWSVTWQLSLCYSSGFKRPSCLSDAVMGCHVADNVK